MHDAEKLADKVFMQDGKIVGLVEAIREAQADALRAAISAMAVGNASSATREVRKLLAKVEQR